MRWRGRRESSNIEDMRGQSSSGSSSRGGGFRMPGGFGRNRMGRSMGRSMGRGSTMRRAGGGGFGTLIVLVIAFLILKQCGFLQQEGMGVDDMMSQTHSGVNSGQNTRNDEMKQFVGVVLAETEQVWEGIFQQEGRRYPAPKLVLFSRAIRSACGQASSATGPFYCPGDNKIYLDTAFFNTLARDFSASGDFANAYVIAHEVGHHVQNVIGILPKFNQMRRSMGKRETNAMSVRVELQADCFAGIWAHYTDQKGLLERGDLEEALNAATQIGDDAIQKRTQGYVVPESFNHGTSEQRKTWFYRGYETGRLRDCNTQIFNQT